MYYIEPTFDLRKIRTQFNGARLLKQKLFNSEISYLIAKVLNEEQDWRNIYAITSSVIRLDEQRSGSETREHYAVIANALRRLTKKGIIEMRKYEPHKFTKSRAFFRSHEWRLKPIEQE
ncbi:hypothetical protein HYE53_01835 [Aggregatibacter actinomycetemcomitans]|uniref:hypothetical protein n=1 Tax=Aggregatibacter actinomycetemcomitans TaxID=714 RepID=UPI00197C32EB|nr:hypothetical protein [Aggregatibacter actinomycetemcomitans]MBN6069887.1 hypothetical protein [Aggregatibacter actinomycetemcomitans]